MRLASGGGSEGMISPPPSLGRASVPIIRCDRSLLPLNVTQSNRRKRREGPSAGSGKEARSGGVGDEVEPQTGGEDLEISPPENASVLLVLFPSSLNVALCVKPVPGNRLALLVPAGGVGALLRHIGALGQRAVPIMPWLALSFLAGAAFSICTRGAKSNAVDKWGLPTVGAALAFVSALPLSFDCVQVLFLSLLWLAGLLPSGCSVTTLALAAMGGSIPLYLGSFLGSIIHFSKLPAPGTDLRSPPAAASGSGSNVPGEMGLSQPSQLLRHSHLVEGARMRFIGEDSQRQLSPISPTTNWGASGAGLLGAGKTKNL